MAKGTPVKGGKAGEIKDIDKTGHPARKPLSPRALYGHKAHAGPQHIPASEIGANMADDLFKQELQRDLDGNLAQGPASSKAVSSKLKNVMVNKGGVKPKPVVINTPGGKKPTRTLKSNPIPPAPGKRKLPLTGTKTYGNQVR